MRNISSRRLQTSSALPDPAPTRVPGTDETMPLQRIREVRLRCGVTVNQASQVLHFKPPEYREFERPLTDVRLRNLHAIAHAFRVSIAELIVPASSEGAKFLDFQKHGKLRQVMRIFASCYEKVSHEERDSNSSKNLFNAMEQLLKIDPSLSTIFPHSLPANPHHRTMLGTIPVQQPRELHRISAVMRSEGFTRRNARKWFNLASPASQYVKDEEQPEVNHPLSRIYTWANVLEVPPAELLVDSEEHGPVAEDVRCEGRLILVVKSVKALLERITRVPEKTMLTAALQSLGTLDPRLQVVNPFPMMPNGGRESEEMGRITHHLYRDLSEQSPSENE